MNQESAIKFIKNHKDTQRFAILPIDEKTFPQLKMIRKFGKDNTYQLAIQGLYKLFQLNGFDKAADMSKSPFAYDIECAARNLLDPIYDRVIPKFTEDEEITAWNLFVNESEFMKDLRAKIINNAQEPKDKRAEAKWQWNRTLNIYDNNYINIMNVFDANLNAFVRNSIGRDAEYYFGDKWFAKVDGKAYSENTPTDMVNTLISKFFKEQAVQKKVFNEWQNWMYEHHDYITGRTNSK